MEQRTMLELLALLRAWENADNRNDPIWLTRFQNAIDDVRLEIGEVPAGDDGEAQTDPDRRPRGPLAQYWGDVYQTV